MARFIIGDVYQRMAELPDGSVDLVLTSPPFLALRSYLPADHPDKDKEIGSEPTPAAFLDTLLALTAEWGRLLAPHGSICVELGDTYAGSGGAGGDYDADGLRAGQERFDGSARRGAGRAGGTDGRPSIPGRKHYTVAKAGADWPQDKSLCGIPHLYASSLAYGRNLLRAPLTARELLDQLEDWSTINPDATVPDLLAMARNWVAFHEPGNVIEIEPWRIRNIVAWARPNPPVGALGDKFRPATSYLTIATKARDRYFDLDAVREPHQDHSRQRTGRIDNLASANRDATRSDAGKDFYNTGNPAGAPPLDYWEIPTHPYKGAHYATWPPALCTRPILTMTPRRVCTTCGKPSRRIVDEPTYVNARTGTEVSKTAWQDPERLTQGAIGRDKRVLRQAATLGWSDCGHGTWRPGHVLDPFAGSGTTLAVATGHARQATGIDLDTRNALLARDRVGPLLLDITWPDPNYELATLAAGAGPDAYTDWLTDQQAEHILTTITDLLHATERPPAPTAGHNGTRHTPELPGQLALLTPTAPQEPT